ncbi:hypothetical protein VTN49DRAFT_2918 [Thermomyces lanuginosus]|uniref:uncharacterized protein n=1 Tax=Thermomyces lanuginosus TaxID=5541 RepID=UPI0037420B2E
MAGVMPGGPIPAPVRRDTNPTTVPSKTSAVLTPDTNAYLMGTMPAMAVGPIASPHAGPQSASAIYQHIQDTAAKRIATLEYLRKTHEGKVHWYNTVHFSRADLQRLPYFESRKLGRRAIHYLLFGLSLPPILDVSTTPLEFLRALNALLSEFETFQQAHSADGPQSNVRARLPQMFRRATQSGPKTRRTSSANEMGNPLHLGDSTDVKAMTGNLAAGSAAGSTTSAANSEGLELLPGEEYTYLMTPSLPFEPDYFETFLTLCDILIDAYHRFTALVASPLVCSSTMGELFIKTDAKLRKVIISGIVREFEDACRNGAKNEMAGVSRVVLGGLLG